MREQPPCGEEWGEEWRVENPSPAAGQLVSSGWQLDEMQLRR